MAEARGQILPRRRRLGLQLDRCIQVFYGFVILRERSLDQPQKLMDLKTVRGLRQEILELGGCLREPPSVVLRHRRLKLTVQLLLLAVLG